MTRGEAEALTLYLEALVSYMAYQHTGVFRLIRPHHDHAELQLRRELFIDACTAADVARRGAP